MLTSEQTITADGSERSPRPVRSGRTWARAAAALGLLGTVLAVLFGFLPVVEHTATITWPSATTGTAPVNAPLVALRPESMSITVPCAAARSLDARTSGEATLVSTVPPTSPEGARSGLVLSVADGELRLTNGGQAVAGEPVPRGPCTLSVTSDGTATTIDLATAQTFTGDVRPQVVGVYSDLDAARDPLAGTAVRITPDTRYDTSPTGAKILVGVLAAACLVGSLVALHRVDTVRGRRPYRPQRRPDAPRDRPTGRDGVVAAVLAVWMAIGGQTSDDGYTLGIARDVATSGYVGNYYRWFNAPEAPFGWFYDLYALWVRVSDSLLWLRLPSVIMGLLAWYLVSRGLLPRLGRQVRRSRAAGWAAATVFLAFWMAYDSGLRPEPVVVVCSLVALVAVERSVALRRVTPAAVGLVAATLALGANPAGLIAVAPFLAAARPLVALVRSRAREYGVLAVLAPLAASGTLILTVVFADQSWAAVLESIRVRAAIGPNWAWFSELATRYAPLFSENADGSVARRFPILLLVLCLVACVVVLLRRSRIPGAATGPAQRLIATTVLSFAIFTLTPTKWTHHFGDLVGLGAGLAALAALATGADGLRSLRNRLVFLAAVAAVAALSFAGPNAWWYTNNWGVPWFDKPPSIEGYQASTALLGLALLLALAALVEHLRGQRDHDDPDRAGRVDAVLARVLPRVPWLGPRLLQRRERTEAPGEAKRHARRALRLASAPVALLCGFVVLLNLGSMLKAIDKQAESWSMGADALSHLSGGSCGLASRVFAERSPLDGVLRPAPAPTGMAPPARADLLPTVAPPPVPGAPAAPPAPGTVAANSPATDLIDPFPTSTGFRRDGVPPTGGGTGVSGYEYSLSGGLGSDAAPAFGSFDPEGRSTGTLRTPWTLLTDEQRRGGTPLVVTLAGRVGAGNALTVQFATRLPDGRVQVVEQAVIDDGRRDEAPWREVRVPVEGTAATASEVRLVAQDTALGAGGWLAVAPLRAPQLGPLSDVVAGQPMFLEYPVSLASPCLRPFATAAGIAEVPALRLRADDSRMRNDGEGWSSPQAGGPLGWIQVIGRSTTVPTYLDGDPGRDWGRVERIQPYEPGVAPTLERTDRTRWGTFTTGPMGAPPPGVPSPER